MLGETAVGVLSALPLMRMVGELLTEAGEGVELVLCLGQSREGERRMRMRKRYLGAGERPAPEKIKTREDGRSGKVIGKTGRV